MWRSKIFVIKSLLLLVGHQLHWRDLIGRNSVTIFSLLSTSLASCITMIRTYLTHQTRMERRVWEIAKWPCRFRVSSKPYVSLQLAQTRVEPVTWACKQTSYPLGHAARQTTVLGLNSQPFDDKLLNRFMTLRRRHYRLQLTRCRQPWFLFNCRLKHSRYLATDDALFGRNWYYIF